MEASDEDTLREKRVTTVSVGVNCVQSGFNGEKGVNSSWLSSWLLLKKVSSSAVNFSPHLAVTIDLRAVKWVICDHGSVCCCRLAKRIGESLGEKVWPRREWLKCFSLRICYERGQEMGHLFPRISSALEAATQTTSSSSPFHSQSQLMAFSTATFIIFELFNCWHHTQSHTRLYLSFPLQCLSPVRVCLWERDKCALHRCTSTGLF